MKCLTATPLFCAIGRGYRIKLTTRNSLGSVTQKKLQNGHRLETSFMLMFFYCLLFSQERLHRVMKYACNRITDLYNRKAKGIKGHILKFTIVLYLFEGTNSICEIKES